MAGAASPINMKLKEVLLDLHSNPYPSLASPAYVPKRASVALILRVQPSHAHWPGPSGAPVEPVTNKNDVAARVESFFAQDWVRHGRPEALFIKRASRRGDRWTGHIALPGGRRDPEDVDDGAAAVRETMEEVGIDLTADSVLPCGNLPQRLVTSSWVCTWSRPFPIYRRLTLATGHRAVSSGTIVVGSQS